MNSFSRAMGSDVRDESPMKSGGQQNKVNSARAGAWLLLACVLHLVLVTGGLAQGGKQGSKPKPTLPGDLPTGGGGPPIRPNDITPTPGKLVEVKQPQIKVAPRKCFLTLFTTAQAQINLTPASTKGRKEGGQADADGIRIFKTLPPGSYQVRITREDYKPLTGTIKVVQGQAVAFKGELIPIYGTLVLLIGDAVGPDVTVKLDGKEVPPEQIKIGDGRIKISRVQADKQYEVRLSKPDYDDLVQLVEVKPGEAGENILTGTMKPATITVRLTGTPNARVSIDGNTEERHFNPEGQLVLNLLKGPHKLIVSLDGYVSAERNLTLSPDLREVEEEINLVPIPEDAEVNVSFKSSVPPWFPSPPAGWKFKPPSGMVVAGDALGLLKETSKLGRDFNIYFDFRLQLSLRLSNGRGAAWVVRARDTRNYYLFELTMKSNELCFYVYRNGNPEGDPDCRPVDAKIVKPGDTLVIVLKAVGNTFTHTIIPNSNPVESKLGGVFTHEAYRWGGVGLRGINGLEMAVDQVLVTPRK